MEFDINKKGKQPIYEYLYKCVKDDIRSGKLAVGDKLPSKRALSKELGISVTSVENAYAQLTLEGFIRGEQGSGFYVNKHVEKVHELPIRVPLDGSEPEQDSVLDFKANRSSVEHFPFQTWSRVMRNVLSESNAEILSTVPYNGLVELRVALSKYLYRYRGMKVEPAQIIIGAGTEYLYARLLQVFGYHTIMAIEDPGYKKFSEISKHQGTLWDYIPMDDDGMRLDLLRQSNANVIHVSPSNHFPTGTVMPMTRRMELIKWANELPERYIIEDDYDSELRYAGKIIPTMYALDEGEKVIYMNTFSKSLVPSIRISYMVLPSNLLERYEETLSFYSCTVSAFEQLTLAKFIEEGFFSRHISRMKEIYKKKRDRMLEILENSALSKISDVREANAGTHLLIHVNTHMTDKEIKRKAQEHHIEVAMLSDYVHHQGIFYMGTVILNYAGLEEEQMQQAMEIFEDIFATDLLKNS